MFEGRTGLLVALEFDSGEGFVVLDCKLLGLESLTISFAFPFELDVVVSVCLPLFVPSFESSEGGSFLLELSSVLLERVTGATVRAAGEPFMLSFDLSSMVLVFPPGVVARVVLGD